MIQTMEQPNRVWVLIPARAGSKGVPEKNTRPLAGKPLLLHALERLASSDLELQLLVSTDSDLAAQLAQPYATVMWRPSDLAGDAATLDEVAAQVADTLLSEYGANDSDILITVQPTSPFIGPQEILECLRILETHDSAISVKLDSHLRWGQNSDGTPRPLFEERVNRQWLPIEYCETGGLIASSVKDLTTRRTRLNGKIGLIELPMPAAIDIDDYADWALAEYFATRRKIVIRADAGPELGMGHVYRAVALARELADHNVTIVTLGADDSIAAQLFDRSNLRYIAVDNERSELEVLTRLRPDLLILDVLDTTTEYALKRRTTCLVQVSFEDLGEGSHVSDLTINDLYFEPSSPSNQWFGVENAILSPPFERTLPSNFSHEVQRIAVTFGGTDPSDLTNKTLRALSMISDWHGKTDVILGPGNVREVDPELAGNGVEVLRSVNDMAAVLRECDLAITSAGRTVTELMSIGVPALVLCQNNRELLHSHASTPFGALNLGLGQLVDSSTIVNHIQLLRQDSKIRNEFRRRQLMAIAERSNAAIVAKMMTYVNEKIGGNL